MAPLRSIQIVQPAPFFKRKITYLVELGLHTQDFTASVAEFAHFMQVLTGQHRTGVAHMGSAANVSVILIGDQIRTRGVHAPRHDGRPSRENEHDVPSELGQLALVARAKAFADAY